MAYTSRADRAGGLDGLPRYAWCVIAVLALSVFYAILQVGFVRPYLWPAGTGATLVSDPAARLPLRARPPRPDDQLGHPASVEQIAPGTSADSAGLAPANVVLAERRVLDGRLADLSRTATADDVLDAWRLRYRLGVSGPVAWHIRSSDGRERTVRLERPAIWSAPNRGEWARRHLGTIVQVLVFTTAALVLLILRSNDATAALVVLALALSAVGGGGPLFGVEDSIPLGLGHVMTVFAWMAGPLAFPVIALAILYFPSRSPLLAGRAWLNAVPVLAAMPMLALGAATGLYLTGADSARTIALWDAQHPGAYFGSFSVALAINIAAIVEGMYRYHFKLDANERRRIRMAAYTAVPGVFAYAIKDGLPIVAELAGRAAPAVSTPWMLFLQALVLLPAFGLVYAVGVERVPGPRVVLGRGLQDARCADSHVDSAGDTTRVLSPAALPMMECPRCGRCEESGTPACPSDGTAMKPVLSVPRTVDNKYRIEQLIGRGGMGAVYRARDVRLDRLVALKVVRADLLGDPEARRRFRREAQIVARLRHPAIVSVFDHGTFADGAAYLVMELVRGEDLRRVMQREGRLEPRRAVRILSAVCGAIEAAHREGVLHRDLKPENILLPGGEYEAKVLDFGVAKVVDDGRGDVAGGDAPAMVTAAGIVVGTPAYMAPEQLRGAAPDARTDIFSLGVIAYELLSGDLPFGRGSLADVVLAHARGVPPLAGVPPALERAVRAALEAEPDRRPASAQAFGHLVAAAVGM